MNWYQDLAVAIANCVDVRSMDSADAVLDERLMDRWKVFLGSAFTDRAKDKLRRDVLGLVAAAYKEGRRRMMS